jgi:uncharacterized tellurite resistance protein B-like protein
MDKDIAFSELLDLYMLAVSDGSINQNETQLLFEIGKQIGLNHDDVLDVINHPKEVKMLKSTSYEERMQHLFRLLFLMKIDGEVKPSEIDLIQQIALHLGLNLNLTNDLVDIIIRHKQSDVPEAEMIAQIKKYLN